MPRPPDGKQRGPGHHTEAPQRSDTTKEQIASTVARQRVAAAKMRRLEEHRQICREAERLMPLARLYGPRPLLLAPIGDYYVRGRWAS